ncbi:MAG: hypothetical protein K2L82_13160 [Lachnospiraceae bacterium]|nr:hypothetical protein [Lachnospiraceae bacterium]
MDFLDEEIMEFRKSAKKSKYNSLETGMYIKDRLVHFEETQVLNEKVSVMLPEGFVDMPHEVAKMKYPSEQRPQVIKTSDDGTVNFTFSLYDTEFNERQMEDALGQFKAIIRKVNPAFIFYDFVVETDKALGWFDFKSYGIDEQIYNVMYLTPVEGKLMHGIFNCLYRDILEWKEPVHQIMMSVTDLTQKKE